MNNYNYGDIKMELKNMKDLEMLAKNDKHLRGVYLDFEKFINEKYTEKIKNTFMLELPHWESEVKKVLREII